MTHRVSVILPVYNGEKYVAKAIESVLAQEYPVHEIIVVDDGSTDGTPAVLKAFGSRILMRRTDNQGVSRARNLGMDLASGDIIAFLDHDDVWFRYKLKRQIEMLDRYPQTGLCASDYYVRNPYLWGRMTRHYLTLSHFDSLNFDAPLKEHPLKVLLREHFVGTPSAVIVKRDVVKEVGGFDPEFKNAQDIDYWHRCAMKTNFVVMSEASLYKRTLPSQLSGNPIKNFNYQKKVYGSLLSKNKEFLKKNRLLKACRGVLAEKFFYLGDLYFEDGKRKESFESYWEGFLSLPSPKNTVNFFWKIAKKSTRLILRDVLNKKRLESLVSSVNPKISYTGFPQGQKMRLWKLYLSRRHGKNGFFSKGPAKTARVSVILPVYNGEKYVAKAIESVLAQEYPVHEIIVVDDGSSDGTPGILARYSGRIVAKRITNSGASNARNVGMRLASGDVLAFLDHDDVWFRSYLKTHLEALSRHPEIGLSCCNYVSRPVGMKGRLVPHFLKLPSLKGFRGPVMLDPFPHLFQECFIGTTSSVLVRKELAQKVGFFNEKYPICQDYDYWLRASRVTGFIVLDDILLHKRVHGANISWNLLKMRLDYEKVQEDFFHSNRSWIRERKMDRWCRRLLAESHYAIGDLVLMRGSNHEFFMHLFAGLRCDVSPGNLLRFLKKLLKKPVSMLALGGNG